MADFTGECCFRKLRRKPNRDDKPRPIKLFGTKGNMMPDLPSPRIRLDRRLSRFSFSVFSSDGAILLLFSMS